MEKLSDEIVETRMGDALEKRLQKDQTFMQRQAELGGIIIFWGKRYTG